MCLVSKNNLVIKGVGGRPVIAAGGLILGRKAIWVIIGTNRSVELLEVQPGVTTPALVASNLMVGIGIVTNQTAAVLKRNITAVTSSPPST